MKRRTPACRYHCRACGSHFTSLRAFDAHRGGPPQDRSCSFPETDAKGNPIVLTEREGVCRIAGPGVQSHVTLYEHESATLVRARFKAENPPGGSAEALL